MQNKITAKNKEHLKSLIQEEIDLHGDTCNLNHIDTSFITDMSYLFSENSQFNGDISNWNISKVEDMKYMFYKSNFNGDISNWNVSNVTDMHSMFYNSPFNGDISHWNILNVEDMSYMFGHSQFNNDISNWDTSQVKEINYIFNGCIGEKPYWAIENNEQRKIAIHNYQLMQKLNATLHSKENIMKNKKIKFN